ncbi:prepilin-type N-terminal cleavage/methylation domain-containing protein [Candidatus Poribacteria bacterium]
MRKLLSQQRGFTLIEVIVGYIVLTITALATCSAFVAGSQLNAKSEDRTIAADIAQLKMEEIKNTYYRYIVYDHPAGETLFKDEPPGEPYWTLNSQGNWITALPEGKCEISYPGLDLNAGIIPDPLAVRVTISWLSDIDANSSQSQGISSLSLKTVFSISPGRMVIR